VGSHEGPPQAASTPYSLAFALTLLSSALRASCFVRFSAKTAKVNSSEGYIFFVVATSPRRCSPSLRVASFVITL
jgi:hypothetical protein